MDKKLTVKKQGKKDVLLEQDVLDESIITVGSNPSATLELSDSNIAPEQFVIISENEHILLMNRAEGTVINGEQLGLGSKVELENGDNIEIGEFNISFSEVGSNGGGDISEDAVDFGENGAVVDKKESETATDFSTVLNNLKEEDSFYFQIVSSENVIERVIFDSENIWMGTSFAECAIKKDKAELDEVYAHIKKDWSGAVIYPDESEDIVLNNEPLKEPTRLKNEDTLVLIDDFAEEDEQPTKITFHEPVVLLALNSILPEDLPEPISLRSEVSNDESSTKSELKEAATDQKQVGKDSRAKTKKRRVFGYFSFLEILIMAFGTLVTAAIIFLVLEFV